MTTKENALNQDAVKQARDFHLQVVEQARRRNEKHRDIEDNAEFDLVMEVIEGVGSVVEQGARKGMKPDLVGRAVQFYARCMAEVYGKKPAPIVPEVKP